VDGALVFNHLQSQRPSSFHVYPPTTSVQFGSLNSASRSPDKVKEAMLRQPVPSWNIRKIPLSRCNFQMPPSGA
jgi:hypothetical protein